MFVQPMIHKRGNTLVVAVSDADDQGLYWHMSLQDGGSTDVRSSKTQEECDNVFLRAIGLLNSGDGWSLFGDPLAIATIPPPTVGAYGMWVRQALSPIHVMVLAAMMPFRPVCPL